jgi:hypothetical protein
MEFVPQKVGQKLAPRSGALRNPPRDILERRTARSNKWIIAFVLLGMFSQLALLNENLAKLRVIFRCAPFLASIALLILPKGRYRHPAQQVGLLALLILALSFANPATYDSPIAALAQCAFYTAIIGPLFWVSSFQVSLRTVTVIVFLFWLFHTLSAFFGVLQTLYPGSYQPAIASALAGSEERAETLRITLADGSSIFRPMGLTDTPGGAAGSGFSAILFGLGILLSTRSRSLTIASVLSIAIGFYVIYLSMVRVHLVTIGICICAAASAFALMNDWKRVTKLVVVIAPAALIAFSLALSVGGSAVQERMTSLTDDSAGSIYYNSRGRFLANTLDDLLPKYPFGAGPGHWGMMGGYFGKPETLQWAEIQWTAWLLDGGILFVLAYFFAVVFTVWWAWRLTTIGARNALASWAVMIFALDVSVVALTFSYPVFCSQSGMEFWLLNACIFSAFAREEHQAKLARMQVRNGGKLRASAAVS